MMMSLMDSVLCEAAAVASARQAAAASNTPPSWHDLSLMHHHQQQQRDTVGLVPGSPDGGQSDAASSSSSYVISSSSGGMMDQSDGRASSNLYPSLLHQPCTPDMDTRDSSPQSTSFDGYDHHPHHLMNTHQQLLSKKSHGSNSNKPHRDPTSHRIIEKRRRDRMNNCLTNLSKLIPSAYLKKGRGRVEKTEIIEMAIRYMKHVELERRQQKRELHEELMLDKGVGTDEDENQRGINATVTQHPLPTQSNQSNQASSTTTTRSFGERYRQGFFDCIAETLRFLAGAEGHQVNDQMKTSLLFHLREYFGKLADIECQQSSSNSAQSSSSPTADKSEEDSDEPLNMSMKRPRTSTPARYPLSQQPSNAANAATSSEMPSSSSVSSGEMRYQHHHHGPSQLRDILETKEPFAPLHGGSSPSKSYGVKTEQQPMIHLPHSTMPSMFLQQKFNGGGIGVFDQKSVFAMGGGIGGGLLTTSAASSVGSRSTSSSNATTTSQYPSSPGSSVNSFNMESPPGLHSPPLPSSSGVLNGAVGGGPGGGFPVPIFALHPIGLYYVPLTVSSHLLDASFHASVLMGEGGGPSPHNHVASHPVTINVNFNFLPNMVNLPNIHAPNVKGAAARACSSSSCGGSSISGSSGGSSSIGSSVILNTAAYATNLRLALKH